MRELKYLLIIGTIDVVKSLETLGIPHSTDILIKTITVFFMQPLHVCFEVTLATKQVATSLTVL